MTQTRSRMFAWLFVNAMLCGVPAQIRAEDPLAPKETPDSESPELYTWRKEHDPNGLGKFYRGREIARVMSFHGAPWLDRPTREKEERLTLLLEVLQLKPGMTVADIGAGSGRISFLMGEQVGPEGRILAVDIQDEMLEMIENRASREKVTNVIPVKGEIRSTGIEAGTVDLAIMVDVYHEFSHPHEMLGDLAKILKPGGRIAWVEYRLEDPEVPIKLVHKMSQAQVKKEAGQKEFGLEFVETIDKLPQQHVIIFQKPMNE